jgi:uncharacterized repeat protein (TIGR03806 family)
MALGGLAGIGGCGGSPAPCSPGAAGADTGAFPSSLSAYCMVSIDKGTVVPKDDAVVPYDLNTPLFSDYATKYRTVWLPPGKSMAYTASGRFELPVGSVITKSFGFAADARSPSSPVKWVETRVLVRGPSGWKGTAYEWDEAQSEAKISVGGDVLSPSFTGTGGQVEQPSYLVPSQSQCHKCHDDSGVMGILGPSAEQLNRSFSYASGKENELAHWSRAGILKGVPSSSAAPVLPVWNDPTTGDVNARARAYLAANCGYCHDGSGGEARTSGLVLTGSETDLTALGVCKAPVAAGKAALGQRFDVVPGHPEQSILIYRVIQTETSLAMPELGRSLEHVEGVDLLSQWVTELPGSCP